MPTRIRKDARNGLNLHNMLMKDRTEDRAKECFLWFMRESAYQYVKVSKFKDMCNVVIRLQRAYRNVKFRRIVRRSLMDLCWERFCDEQKKAA